MQDYCFLNIFITNRKNRLKKNEDYFKIFGSLYFFFVWGCLELIFDEKKSNCALYFVLSLKLLKSKNKYW